MGELCFAGMAPHGFSIIEEIAGKEVELFAPTRKAMIEFDRELVGSEPDSVIVLTPHGLRLKGFNSIYTTEYCRGSLSQFDSTVYLEYKCDRELATNLLESVEKTGIPVVGANYGTLSGPLSNIDMDWGTLIPLYYCDFDKEKKPELVVVTPTREVSYDLLITMGKTIGEEIKKSKKRIAVIASADQAHAHDLDGFYGFSALAKVFDELIIDILKRDALEELKHIDDNIVEAAMPDSLWQMLILYGIFQIFPKSCSFINYQVPTYFGMTVATFK